MIVSGRHFELGTIIKLVILAFSVVYDNVWQERVYRIEQEYPSKAVKILRKL
jgi:hypothetical protein